MHRIFGVFLNTYYCARDKFRIPPKASITFCDPVRILMKMSKTNSLLYIQINILHIFLSNCKISKINFAKVLPYNTRTRTSVRQSIRNCDYADAVLDVVQVSRTNFAPKLRDEKFVCYISVWIFNLPHLCMNLLLFIFKCILIHFWLLHVNELQTCAIYTFSLH